MVRASEEIYKMLERHPYSWVVVIQHAKHHDDEELLPHYRERKQAEKMADWYRQDPRFKDHNVWVMTHKTYLKPFSDDAIFE